MHSSCRTSTLKPSLSSITSTRCSWKGYSRSFPLFSELVAIQVGCNANSYKGCPHHYIVLFDKSESKRSTSTRLHMKLLELLV
ncbi:DYW_deaminase domain-containing protein [Psidium guajava]|nr:DYW_deaminase domain-containing protein [Psidium guajava]